MKFMHGISSDSNCGVDVPEYADVEVSSSVMRYINLRFTYLLTYLLDAKDCSARE